jgi:TetR/AcrR family transcriptional regulator, tetracycline repressor protein
MAYGVSVQAFRHVPLPKGSLSLDVIVPAALRIADAEGLDAVSMRGVAAEVGCEAMSLYKHVADKQALLDLVVEAVLAEFEPPSRRLGWRRRIVAVAEELRRLAMAHPHVWPLLVVRLPATARSLVPIDELLRALDDAGLSEGKAITAFWAIVGYITGALVSETARETGTQLLFPVALPGAPSGLDHLDARAAMLRRTDCAAEYGRGLDLLLAGVVSSEDPPKPSTAAVRRR